MKCRSKNVRPGDRFVVSKSMQHDLVDGHVWKAVTETPSYIASGRHGQPRWLMENVTIPDDQCFWYPLMHPFERAE